MFRTNGTGFFSNHLWVESLLTRYQHTFHGDVQRLSWWMSAHNGSSITGPQSIVNFYLGLYYFFFIVFFKWSQTKWISVYQVLGGRLIDRVDEKGRYNCPLFSTKLFPYFIRTLITEGDWLIEVQLHLNIMIRPKPMHWYIVSTVFQD